VDRRLSQRIAVIADIGVIAVIGKAKPLKHRGTEEAEDQAIARNAKIAKIAENQGKVLLFS
jgi:hypothetical protein